MNGEWKWEAWGFFPTPESRGRFCTRLKTIAVCVGRAWSSVNGVGSLWLHHNQAGFWHGEVCLLVTLGISSSCPNISWGAALQEARACHAFCWGTWAYSMFLVFARMGYLAVFASCSVMAVCLMCWCLFLFCSSFVRATPCPAACSLPW